jgi:DNA-binding CsgD family transcriptional regulator
MRDFTLVTSNAHLAPREKLVAVLYADGQSCPEISSQTGIAVSTIRSVIRDIRRRYRMQGRPAPTKLALRSRLIEDGHLRP